MLEILNQLCVISKPSMCREEKIKELDGLCCNIVGSKLGGAHRRDDSGPR